MQNVKLLLVTFGILAIGMLGLAPTVAFAQTATNNSMTIAGTCGITIDNSLSFGSVDPDAQSGYEELQITPTGNGDVILDLYATDWLDTGSTNVINGEKTKFSFVNGTAYTSATPLNSTDGTISYGTLDNTAGTNSSYWQVEATLNTGSFVGSVQQDMTFMVSSCA